MMFILLIAIGSSVVLLLLLFLAWYRYTTRTKHLFIDKVCIVVGANKGIGQSVALQLAKKQVKLLILVDIVDCSETIRLCKDSGCEGVVQVDCDISSKDQVEKCFKELPISDVSLLINCAGVVSGQKFVDLSVDDFSRVINVNLLGNFLLVKQVLPYMLKRNDGCIVTISSLMGLMGGARLSDYCSSKFATVGLFEALRFEFYSSHPNVSFVTVCPYAVDTGMFNGIFEATALTRLVRKVFPILKTEEVASTIITAAQRGSPLVVVPFYFSPLINLVRCLPEPLYSYVLILMGARDGMNKFSGSSSIRPQPHILENYLDKAEVNEERLVDHGDNILKASPTMQDKDDEHSQSGGIQASRSSDSLKLDEELILVSSPESKELHKPSLADENEVLLGKKDIPRRLEHKYW